MNAASGNPMNGVSKIAVGEVSESLADQASATVITELTAASGSTVTLPMREFLRTHALWPALVFGVAALAMRWSGSDVWLADAIYGLEGGRWALQDHYLTSAVLHDGAKTVGRVVISGLLLIALVSGWHPRLRGWARPLWYLIVAMGGSVALVGWVKRSGWGLCPWDMTRYGGNQPVGFSYFAPLPGQTDTGHCFPAGHSAGGFALLALYFLLLHVRPQWALRGLAVGLGFGLLLGFDQQLRGAHFLSHDLWTATLCWFTSLGFYLLFFRRPLFFRRAQPALWVAGARR